MRSSGSCDLTSYATDSRRRHHISASLSIPLFLPRATFALPHNPPPAMGALPLPALSLPSALSLSRTIPLRLLLPAGGVVGTALGWLPTHPVNSLRRLAFLPGTILSPVGGAVGMAVR